MNNLRTDTIRLASTYPPGDPIRVALLSTLATEAPRVASETPAAWAAIFDSLRPGQSVHIAMKSVMGRSDLTNGEYHEWKVGRRSTSKVHSVDTIPLIPLDGEKPNKFNQYALRKRGDKVSGAHGDMAVMLIGIRPG